MLTYLMAGDGPALQPGAGRTEWLHSGMWLPGRDIFEPVMPEICDV